MARSHPAEFRRKVLDLLKAGRPVAGVAQQLGMTGQTIYRAFQCAPSTYWIAPCCPPPARSRRDETLGTAAGTVH